MIMIYIKIGTVSLYLCYEKVTWQMAKAGFGLVIKKMNNDGDDL